MKGVSFTHLVAWAIVRAAQDFSVMGRTFEERDGKPFVVEPGAISLGIAVDVERKGQRSLIGPDHQGRQRDGTSQASTLTTRS